MFKITLTYCNQERDFRCKAKDGNEACMKAISYMYKKFNWLPDETFIIDVVEE